jgi:threonine dehydrogenase-like Zn-dependent dehydrogenase
VPDNVPNDVAVLAEPFAVGIHAVAPHLPPDNDTVLVIGAGIIALSVIAAIRAFGSRCRIIAACKYQFQADAATRLGADEILLERNPKELYAKVAELTSGKLYKPALGRRILYGNHGPDTIFDCVGTEETIANSLHLVRCNGTVVIVGVSFGVTKKVDWYLTISKELAVFGAMCYGKDQYQGELVPTFDLALQFLAQDPDRYAGLVTHRFPIEKYKEAIKVHERKGKQKAIKIVFDFTNGK